MLRDTGGGSELNAVAAARMVGIEPEALRGRRESDEMICGGVSG